MTSTQRQLLNVISKSIDNAEGYRDGALVKEDFEISDKVVKMLEGVYSKFLEIIKGD